jgi:hypothetical protein
MDVETHRLLLLVLGHVMAASVNQVDQALGRDLAQTVAETKRLEVEVMIDERLGELEAWAVQLAGDLADYAAGGTLPGPWLPGPPRRA